MALGGNLKKKSLIPSEDKKKSAAKKTAAKKPVAKKTATKKSTKKKSEKPAQQVDVATEVVGTRAEPAKPIASKAHEAPSYERHLSKFEYERRQRLHQRFHEEVQALKGRQVHLIVFQIEEEEFAIDISKVSEVVITPAITRMPQAPKYVPGIATIRGKGVVTLDLAHKLGYMDANEHLDQRSEYTIVVKTDRFSVGLLVPDVPKNQMISGDIIQPAIDNVSETSLDETYIKGLVRLDGRMIFYIDIDEMIEGDRLKSRLIEE